VLASLRSEPQEGGRTLNPFMSRLNPCKRCGGLPRFDQFKPPSSDWVYLVECSAKDCDNAEVGDTPQEAAHLWNFSNPDWDGNVPSL
jgi:hypothetical protein